MINGEKRSISKFETLVFSITRVFAIGGAAVVVIGIIFFGIKLLFPGGSTAVSYSEVARKMAATTGSYGSETGSTPGNTSTATGLITDDLKPYFVGENARVMQRWLADLSEEQQKDFISNMSLVMRDAKVAKVDPSETINTYKLLKLQKLNSSMIEEYREIATKAGYVAAIFGLLLILSIISLVLVMLSIERNTRLAVVSPSMDPAPAGKILA